ncbi:MAG: hypothetical protein V7K40_26320 [Nostoc sp.]|uniref:hypothetical protein n=1 Tax=Nostoc sp. TaxID=1180 RepID=UPI002FFAE4F5
MPQLVGTPIKIADKLEALFHEQAGDSFVISPTYSIYGQLIEDVRKVIKQVLSRLRLQPSIPLHRK